MLEAAAQCESGAVLKCSWANMAIAAVTVSFGNVLETTFAYVLMVVGADGYICPTAHRTYCSSRFCLYMSFHSNSSLSDS